MMRVDYPDLSTPDIPYLARLLFLGPEGMPISYLYRESTSERAKVLAPAELEIRLSSLSHEPIKLIKEAGGQPLLSPVIKDSWDAWDAWDASNASNASIA